MLAARLRMYKTNHAPQFVDLNTTSRQYNSTCANVPRYQVNMQHIILYESILYCVLMEKSTQNTCTHKIQRTGPILITQQSQLLLSKVRVSKGKLLLILAILSHQLQL